MVVITLLLSNGDLQPLDGMDLTRADNLVAVTRLLNMYLHEAAMREMTEAIRAKYPCVRSRSSSILSSSTESSGIMLDLHIYIHASWCTTAVTIYRSFLRRGVKEF